MPTAAFKIGGMSRLTIVLLASLVLVAHDALREPAEATAPAPAPEGVAA